MSMKKPVEGILSTAAGGRAFLMQGPEQEA
jgi:hypothetical protein